MILPSLPAMAVAGVFTAVATLVGGGIALRLKAKLSLLTAFGSGVVIAVALLDLLPEAFSLSGDAPSPLSLMVKVTCGFAVYLIVDRFAALFSKSRPDRRGHLAPALLTFHSAMDGLAIGLALQVSTAAGWLVIIGVLAHDFVDGANSVILSTVEGENVKRAIGWLIANAAAPSLGMIASRVITLSSTSLAECLALFGGGFLYVGASELLPRSRTEGNPIANGAATVLGLIAFYFIVLGA